ncbi:hypothetical protein BC624_110104 [Flavobacterium granuli]|uniref:Uncharacterized protein n=1 Tax=Flavobacterium granuli TaxID=280093 RepID=A0A1M5SRE7_9FLAO|nr:hypothetical protein BC624_110104 [Flavobacterium granuli]SHH41020.1 hypothetical protein SAMN05443373_112103 [Flavobacterium granuli]
MSFGVRLYKEKGPGKNKARKVENKQIKSTIPQNKKRHIVKF